MLLGKLTDVGNDPSVDLGNRFSSRGTRVGIVGFPGVEILGELLIQIEDGFSLPYSGVDLPKKKILDYGEAQPLGGGSGSMISAEQIAGVNRIDFFVGGKVVGHKTGLGVSQLAQIKIRVSRKDILRVGKALSVADKNQFCHGLQSRVLKNGFPHVLLALSL